MLGEAGVDVTGIFFEEKRTTMAKKRVVSQHQQLLRFDSGTTEPISQRSEEKVLPYLKNHFASYDLVIASDYGYGFFKDEVVSYLAMLQRSYPKTFVLDTQDFAKFSSIDVTAVKPNYAQAVAHLGVEGSQKERRNHILHYEKQLRDSIHAQILACTVDREGTVIFEADKYPFFVDTVPQPNMNASGAGDTFVSAFGLALASGASTEDAAIIASHASENVVRKTGTSQCTIEDLRQSFRPNKKYVQSLQDLSTQAAEYHRMDKRIILTSGCFDRIHGGHITFLNNAKKEGDILIVAVNTDISVKKIQGKPPEHRLADRLKVLEQMEVIDHLVSFDDLTPHRVIEGVKPHIFVKGGNYEGQRIPEKNTVEEHGGELQILPFTPDTARYSSQLPIHFFLI